VRSLNDRPVPPPEDLVRLIRESLFNARDFSAPPGYCWLTTKPSCGRPERHGGCGVSGRGDDAGGQHHRRRTRDEQFLEQARFRTNPGVLSLTGR
jgi:hypothetical protein